MEPIARESLLYDLYGALLTDRKRQVMEYYHEDDMSLSEIAGEMGITRAAVYDSLKSAEQKLEKYEEKLGLLSRYEKSGKLAERAEKLIDGSKMSPDNKKELRDIIGELRDMSD